MGVERVGGWRVMNDVLINSSMVRREEGLVVSRWRISSLAKASAVGKRECGENAASSLTLLGDEIEFFMRKRVDAMCDARSHAGRQNETFERIERRITREPAAIPCSSVRAGRSQLTKCTCRLPSTTDHSCSSSNCRTARRTKFRAPRRAACSTTVSCADCKRAARRIQSRRVCRRNLRGRWSWREYFPA